MFANHPLTLVRYRDLRHDALLREAAAHQNGLLALRGRARREAAQPAPLAVAASLPAATRNQAWPRRTVLAWERVRGQ